MNANNYKHQVDLRMTMNDYYRWLDGCSDMYQFCPFCNILTPRQYFGQGEGGISRNGTSI